jgi:hypothetical protein
MRREPGDLWRGGFDIIVDLVKIDERWIFSHGAGSSLFFEGRILQRPPALQASLKLEILSMRRRSDDAWAPRSLQRRASLRDVGSMFPDDGDMFRTAACTDGSGSFVHSSLWLAQREVAVAEPHGNPV